MNGFPVENSPRHILKKILKLYENRNLVPVVSPEVEFYLVKQNSDPDYPLEVPVGQSGRQETGKRSYGIDAINEFDADSIFWSMKFGALDHFIDYQ